MNRTDVNRSKHIGHHWTAIVNVHSTLLTFSGTRLSRRVVLENFTSAPILPYRLDKRPRVEPRPEQCSHERDDATGHWKPTENTPPVFIKSARFDRRLNKGIPVRREERGRPELVPELVPLSHACRVVAVGSESPHSPLCERSAAAPQGQLSRQFGVRLSAAPALGGTAHAMGRMYGIKGSMKKNWRTICG